VRIIFIFFVLPQQLKHSKISIEQEGDQKNPSKNLSLHKLRFCAINNNDALKKYL
jgi:hypothetical protein